MTRLVPQSLAGRLIALLLLALVVSQAVSYVIYLDERRHALRAAGNEFVLARTASIYRLLEDTPSSVHARILETASTPRMRMWLADDSAVDSADVGHRDEQLVQRLEELIGSSARQVLVEVDTAGPDFFDWRRRDREEDRRPDRAHDDERDDRRPKHERPRLVELTISVQPPSGPWLNVATVLPPLSSTWTWPSLVSMAIMAVAITLIVVIVVRRITRPMQRLADAADRFGRGDGGRTLAEEGPEEVRRTTRAFNRMRGRLQRFVQDRTRMLAAISHDLRTPITTLRLRAELLDDGEARDKMLETLDEMQRMTEATLAFAREEAAAEDTRVVDLAALIGSLCEDLADIGQDVAFADAGRTPYTCRPVALKRAFRNLIENAVRYGERARVALETRGDEIRVTVDDDGPGIADVNLERVFAPFVRLEESRSQETGGIGLGMAIARSIVRGHGGDIELANRAEGGLRVTVRLPRG